MHLQEIHSTFMHFRAILEPGFIKAGLMFHKNVANSLRSISTVPTLDPQPSSASSSTGPRLVLLPAGGDGSPQKTSSALIDFIAISSHRCSAFFAEAAVLVLVLALLDRFMLKGRMEIGWVVSAFTISLILLSASIATEFTARRWLKAH
jgi:hypothetical protein